MDNRNTILEELRELSPAVANISKKNVYTVPFGYFDKFTEKLLSKMRQKEQGRSFEANPMPFSVPAGYFESLASKIVTKAKQQAPEGAADELEEIAPTLLLLGRNNVLSVPAGYFQNLATAILQKVAESRSASTGTYGVLDKIINKNPLAAPAVDYFNSLADNILKKIKNQHKSEVAAELEEIAPLLSTINKQPVFTVPAGYFESISVAVPSLVEPAKIRPMFAKVQSWTRYAAAAVIGGIILAGSIVFLNNDAQPTYNATSSNIKKEQAEKFTPEQIKTLTDKEIKEYLSSNGSLVDAPILTEDDKNNIESYFKDMSDEEIKQYLRENAEPSDAHPKDG